MKATTLLSDPFAKSKRYWLDIIFCVVCTYKTNLEIPSPVYIYECLIYTWM